MQINVRKKSETERVTRLGSGAIFTIRMVGDTFWSHGVRWTASSSSVRRARPLPLCLRDKFSRRRQRLWQVKYGYCVHPLLSLSLPLWALCPSPILKLRTHWSAHVAVDTIERHYLSRTEIKKVEHGGENERTRASQRLDGRCSFLRPNG